MAAHQYKIDSDLDANARSLTERREVTALYYDKKVIAPLWMKVSTTPWTAFAKSAGGYGRLIDDTSVSHDCPSFMHIPEVMQHAPSTGMGGEFSGNNRPRPVIHRDDTTISADAPDWFQIPSVVNWRQDQKTNPDPGHIKMVLGKEVIFEPKIKSSRDKIDWNALTKRTARTARSGGGEGKGGGGGGMDSARMTTGRADSARRDMMLFG